MRAIWDGAVLAESDDAVVVEGNHYFPRSAVDPQYVRDSTTRTLSVSPASGAAAALALIDRRQVVRECELDAAGLLRLHELAAAGGVHLDWGAGGWQFFTADRRSRPRGPSRRLTA